MWRGKMGGHSLTRDSSVRAKGEKSVEKDLTRLIDILHKTTKKALIVYQSQNTRTYWKQLQANNNEQ